VPYVLCGSKGITGCYNYFSGYKENKSSTGSNKFPYFHRMNLIGNIIWLVFGGFLAALGYIFGGFILCCTIVGIPWGLQCFKIAGLVLWPFGKKIVPKQGREGCLSLFCNIVWLIFGGLYTALIHLVFAAILFITIIGIPFARQHLKLMEISLIPFSRDIVN
jgi:uncharacterized membrane protein YccF (DUF307 family)